MKRFCIFLSFLLIAFHCHAQRFVRYFDTVPQMAASNPSDPHLYVVVGGGVAFNDSGSAQWKWVAGETGANGDDRIASTWVNPPIGLWIRINEAGVVFPGGSTNYSTIVVPTIADLKNVSVTNGIQSVQVESYNNRGDGGGGDFLYRASSTEVEDGMINIAPNNGIGGDMWERAITDNSLGVRPPWAGGYTTNGTIQRAIDYAADNDKVRTVVIPSGTHMLNCQTGIVMRSNVRLIGDPGAVLQTEANPTVSYCTITFEPGATNWAIQNLVFDGWPSAPGSASNTGRAIFLSGASNGIISGCTFTNFWSESLKLGTNDWLNVEIADTSGVRNSILAFGATRDYGDDDSAALREAVAYSKRSGYELVFPGGHYRGTNTLDVTGCALEGFGLATVYDTRFSTSQTGDTNQSTISGLKFQYYNFNSVNEIISVNGDNTVIQNCFFNYTPEVTGTDGVGTVSTRDDIGWTAIEVSNGAEHVRIKDCVMNMPLRAGMIITGGKDIEVSGCRVHAIDDGISVKATISESSMISINNCYFTNVATLLGLGTEVRFPVHTIHVSDCLVENADGPLRIKPGSGTVYTNQTIRGIHFENIKIADTNGARYQYAILVSAYAGMLIDDISFKDIDINVRAATNSVPRLVGYFIAAATPQIASTSVVYQAATITNVTISGINANVLTNSLGYGLDNGLFFQAYEGGKIGGVQIRDVRFNNLGGSPIVAQDYYDTNYTEGVLYDFKIDGVTAVNCNNVSTNIAGIYMVGDPAVNIKNIDLGGHKPTTSTKPGIVIATNGVVVASRGVGSTGRIPPDKTWSMPIWQANEDSWVYKLRLMTYAGVTQNNTNYATFSFRNVDTGQVLETNNTTLAGLNLQPGRWTSLNVTNYDTGSQFTNSSPLTLDITQVGTGADIDNLVVEVQFLPYGGGGTSGGGIHHQKIQRADNEFQIVHSTGRPDLIINSKAAISEGRLLFQDTGTNVAALTWDESVDSATFASLKAGSLAKIQAPTSVEFWGGNAKRWEVNSSGHLIPNGSNVFNVGSLLIPAAEIFGKKIYPANPAAAFVSGGTGSPEGAVTAPIGSLWIRTDGGAGTTLYTKESGAGNTGWVAVGSGVGSAPTSAQYVTLATDGTLSAERTLTGTANEIVITDGGANNPVTIGIPDAPAFVGPVTVNGSGTNAMSDLFVTNALASATLNGSATTNLLSGALGITIDGGGVAITTGVKGFITAPYACTIQSVTMLADQSGSAVVDVWKDTYANYPPTVADTITAAAKPTISAAIKSQSSTLTGWTTSVAAGEVIGFNVDSAATITRLTLVLRVLK